MGASLVVEGSTNGIPVEEPPQRLATGPHSFLAVRCILQEQAYNPDVLPWGSALLSRTQSSSRCATERPRSI
jgi:hypothetical protein